jgi:hypothetical protein
MAEDIGYWARSGASQRKESVMYIDRDGKTKRARKSKWRTAFALTAGQTKAILRESRPTALKQHNTAIQKRETGKVRPVVNAGDEDYLRMLFISLWLETALDGHPKSTLFMSTEQLIMLWERLSRNCLDDTVKIPLDQSHFDWQANKRMISRFLDVVARVIETYATERLKGELLHVLAAIRVSLVDLVGVLRVDIGDIHKNIPIEKGIMSGWRWTALMDTVINWGELYAARQLVMRMGGIDPVIEAVAQGDDDQVRSPNYGTAAALAEAYTVMNFEVNPSKFFLSTERDEYLRQVAQPGVVAGYPIRGLTAVLWRNPVSKDPVAGILRMGEQLKSWNLLIGRGGDPTQCLRMMKIDMSQGNGLSTDEVDRLLATPTCAGGLGLFPPGETWLSMSPGRVDVHANIVETTVKGLDSELKRWKSLGLDITKKEAMQSLSSNLELSDARKEVAQGGVEEVTPWRQYLWEPKATGVGIPLQARPNQNLPRTLGSYALQRAVRDRDWDWIREVWLDPTMRSVSDAIETRGGRTVWVDWLLDKLPWKTPNVLGWSDLVPSVLYRRSLTAAWSRIVGMNKFTYRSVKKAALTAELWVHNDIAHRGIRLGG